MNISNPSHINAKLNQCAMITAFGEAADVVTLKQSPLPPLGNDDVRIKMLACPINPSDIVTISGAYAARIKLPFAAGFEGVGIVQELGKNITKFHIGQRLMAIKQSGTWQHFHTVMQDHCFAIDEDLTLEQAATSYINPMTAIQMVEQHAKITKNMHVAINAANSEIGRILIMLAFQNGAKVTAIVRSKRARNDLHKIFAAKITILDQKEHSETNFDVVFDAIGGKDILKTAQSIKQNGHIIHYGLLSGQPIDLKLRQQRPDIKFELYWLRNWIHQAHYDDIQTLFNRVFDMMRKGDIIPKIDRTYPLEHIKNALKRQADPQRNGKILLTPNI